jgi:hypothetical protein
MALPPEPRAPPVLLIDAPASVRLQSEVASNRAAQSSVGLRLQDPALLHPVNNLDDRDGAVGVE